MNKELLALQAEMYACVAEVERMKADNACTYKDHCWDGDCFAEQAQMLVAIAERMRKVKTK